MLTLMTGNEARMSALPTLTQHSAGNSRQCNEARKEKKWHADGKGR